MSAKRAAQSGLKANYIQWTRRSIEDVQEE